jgi:Tfp pilus assembly protein PilF
VQSVGRLRVAVEHPRQGEAGRLFAEALAAHRAGDLVTARTLYERVLQLSPNDADALNNLGVLLSGQREFDRALDLLRRAASIAPNSAGTWNNIGTALREQGRGSDAAAAFRHALTLDPQHEGAKVGLAQQYLSSGSVAQARTLLEDVLSSNPALPEAHYALGQALELQGDRVGAIRAYSEFIRRAPPGLAAYVERTRRHVESLSFSAP